MGSELKHIQAKVVEPRMHSYSCWLVVSESELGCVLEDLSHSLQAVGFDVLSFQHVPFPGGGATAFWVLAESHLAVHHFVESNTMFVELTSCNEQKREAFVRALQIKKPYGEQSRTSSGLLD